MNKMLVLISIGLVSIVSCAIPPVRQDCIFNNQTYFTGQTIQSACFVMNCTYGRWNFTGINEKCALCDLVDDPHIITFDQYKYDWQKRCNYSIAQYFVCENTDDSYNASYGIYGDFKDCLIGLPGATCLFNTTYKVDKYTAITITHQETPVQVQMEINGNLISLLNTPSSIFPYPVIAWKISETIWIVGPDFSIIATGNHLMIYALPSKQYQLGGLCGNFTAIIEPDERTSRKCIPEANIFPFASTWLTAEQNPNNGAECKMVKETPVVPCNGEKYRDTCEKNIGLVFQDPNCGKPTEEIRKIAIENCIKDCCAIPQLCDKFINVAKNFTCDLGRNNALTIKQANASSIVKT